MPIEYISASEEKWLDYLKISPQATVFHHPSWINMLADFYGFQSFVAVLTDSDGDILAGIPVIETKSWLGRRRWISLPFTDHCVLLVDEEISPAQLWARFADEYQNGLNVVEIRSKVTDPIFRYRNKDQVLHLLKLSSNADEVYKGFHHSQVKRNISKAEREGVTIRWAENKNDLDIFYDLYVGTRRRLGVPPQPKGYFDLLWERVLNNGFGFILFAEKDTLPIAGAVFLTFKDKIIYKYGASESDYWQYRPNHKLFWTAIQWGCENRYTFFDWGRTDLDDAGLRDFKRRWGAEESILTYSFLSDIPPKGTATSLAHLARPIIQRAPKWVARLAGEWLYKFLS